jgi:prevent-host-death family protein
VDSVDVFSVRDLRQRSGDLIREAEHGHLSLITKRGRPAILAVPFDERLLELGVHRALALRLFEQRHLTLVQAARLAAVNVEEFVALLGDAGIPAVDYPPDELAEELVIAR